MPRHGLTLCMLCGESVDLHGSRVFSLRLSKPGGECVELRWHMEPSAGRGKLPGCASPLSNRGD